MTGKRSSVFLALFATSAAFFPAATASAASLSPDSVINPPGHYGLANRNSGLCLVVLASGAYGSRATQTTCGNFEDQSWSVNTYGVAAEIKNDYSGQCLTAQGTADGAPVFQYTCTGLNDQKWYASPVTGDATWYVNLNSGKCLVVQGMTEGNAAFQYSCGHYQDQYWDY